MVGIDELKRITNELDGVVFTSSKGDDCRYAVKIKGRIIVTGVSMMFAKSLASSFNKIVKQHRDRVSSTVEAMDRIYKETLEGILGPMIPQVVSELPLPVEEKSKPVEIPEEVAKQDDISDMPFGADGR